MRIGQLHAATRPTETLIVMLPGGLMTPQHYVDAGFPAMLQESRFTADLQLPEFNFNRINIAPIISSTLSALHRDIILPARQRGYRRIVLGGISLGGAVAMHYAREYPGIVDSLCLLSPYPGSRLTAAAIRAAGGLGTWTMTEEQARDPEFLLWAWLSRGTGALPIYLGYGREDRFADGLKMLESALPAARRHTEAGGHDWPTWRALWKHYLSTGLLRLAKDDE